MIYKYNHIFIKFFLFLYLLFMQFYMHHMDMMAMTMDLF